METLDLQAKKIYLIGLSWFLAFFSCVFFVVPASAVALKADSTELNISEAPKSESAETIAINAACELICQGKFDAADKVLVESSQLGQLASIIGEYELINLRRQSARGAAYKEQMAELGKSRSQTDVDKNEVNDVNDITKILGIINKVVEFANDSQRERLLSDAIVKQVFQRTKEKANQF